MTTHSPYFVQHVPLRDLRLVSLRGGCTEVASLPQHIVSDLPWNDSLDGFIRGSGGRVFFRDVATNRVAARCWFDMPMAARLLRCYRRDPDLHQRTEAIRRLRHACRFVPSAEDEEKLGFHGRRVRGEIFFARRWLLVEGVTEYLLLHALGRAIGWPLDSHGAAVIDFQQGDNAGIYPALAQAFRIPWHMIVDGDSGGTTFRQQILDRGFKEAELDGRFFMLPPPNDLENQLIADGHEPMLRQMLLEIGGGDSALTCPADEFRRRLEHRKPTYMGILSLRVAADPALAQRMPAAFVNLVTNLRDGTA